VLQGFAQLAKSAVRTSDLCCRYGGEEFAVLLAAADADVAWRRMSQLLQQFAAVRFDTPDGKTFSASFSAGVALADGTCATLDELLRRADEALYAAKRAGRQRVEMYGA
jgi:two-component system, cell cycle response regulator